MDRSLLSSLTLYDAENQSDTFMRFINKLLDSAVQRKGIVEIKNFTKGLNNTKVFIGSGDLNKHETQCILQGDSGGPLIYNGQVVATSAAIIDGMGIFKLEQAYFNTLDDFSLNMKRLPPIGKSPSHRSLNDKLYCMFAVQ